MNFYTPKTIIIRKKIFMPQSAYTTIISATTVTPQTPSATDKTDFGKIMVRVG